MSLKKCLNNRIPFILGSCDDTIFCVFCEKTKVLLRECIAGKKKKKHDMNFLYVI